uniref:Histidine-rich glycoprotein n=1 Tax=Glossina brevipalpis TaxID=37001 RepID=A0A1A9WV40_9MUSC
MKFIILCSFFLVAASALKIHDLGHYGGHHEHGHEHGHELGHEHGHELGHEHGHEEAHVEYSHHEVAPHHEETEHHHHVEHKHAQSHQSVKLHHYHAVPVYVKKEDQHLVKKPVEIGDTKQILKQIHPETEKNHNHGAVLEEHSESKFHHVGHHEEPHFEHYHDHE